MRALRTAASALVLLALGACGSSSSTGTASSASSVGGAAASSAAILVQTASASVAGTSETVLTDAQGLTLYYKSADTPTSITCTGGCAANWPPLLASSGTPQGTPSVTGKLSVLNGPNGNQVLYNGHPLYRWIQDTAPGQATGQGVGGFLVATPDVAASS